MAIAMNTVWITVATHMSRLAHWFTPAQAGSGQPDTHAHSLLVGIGLITSVFALFYVTVSYLVGFSIGLMLMLTCFLLLLAILAVFRVTGRFRWCANLYLACCFFVAILGCSFYTGGLHSMVLPWFSLVPVASVLLLEFGLDTIVWTLLTCAIVLAYGLAGMLGFEFFMLYDTSLTDFFDAACILGLVLILSLIAFTFGSNRKRALAAILAAQRNLAEAQQMALIGSWERDLVHDRTRWSAEMYRIFGMLPEADGPSYQTFLDALHADDRDWVQQAYTSSLALGGKYAIEYRIVRKTDGQLRWGYARCEHVRDAQGKVLRSIGTVQDITERKLTDIALRSQKEYLQAIFETEPECVKVVAANGFLKAMNPAGLAMLEVDSLEEAQKLGLHDFIDPAYRDAFVKLHKSVCAGNPGILEFPIKGRKGTVRWLETHATPLHDEKGQGISLLAVTRDITEHKLFQKELEQQARIDYLTGVNNRGHFMQLADLELARAIRYGSSLSIFMMDIDFFKQINDGHGHKVGDTVLKKLAEVCRQTLREVDIIGRVGGEEFAVLLPETEVNESVEVAERLRQAIANAKVPMESGLPIQVNVSIGVTSLVSNEDNLDVLLSQADNALYQAKNSGRNKVCVG